MEFVKCVEIRIKYIEIHAEIHLLFPGIFKLADFFTEQALNFAFERDGLLKTKSPVREKLSTWVV